MSSDGVSNACEGAPDCRRPARWQVITDEHGALLLRETGYGPRMCKRHAESEFSRQRAELPDTERRRQYHIIALRLDAVGTLSQAAGKLEEMDWRLARTDPGFSAQVRLVLEQAGLELGAAQRLRTLCTALYQQAREHVPTAAPETVS